MDRLINADKLVSRIESISKPDDTIKVWQMIEMLECTPAECYLNTKTGHLIPAIPNREEK